MAGEKGTIEEKDIKDTVTLSLTRLLGQYNPYALAHYSAWMMCLVSLTSSLSKTMLQDQQPLKLYGVSPLGTASLTEGQSSRCVSPGPEYVAQV